MQPHTVTLRKESRVGMRQVDYRVVCSCGWTEKAIDEQTAIGRGNYHKDRPNN